MAELLDRVDSAEFVEWQVLYAYEPWGFIHETRLAAWDILHAVQLQSRRGTRLKLDDFMLSRGLQDIEMQREETHAQQLLAGFMAYNKRLKVRRGNAR